MKDHNANSCPNEPQEHAIALGCIGFAEGNENVFLLAASVVVFSAGCGNLVGHPAIGATIGLFVLTGSVACGWCVSQFGELGRYPLPPAALCRAIFGAELAKREQTCRRQPGDRHPPYVLHR